MIDTSQVGGLFTLFLHAPLLAFSFICGIEEISPDTWEQCSGLITQAECKIAELMATATLGKQLVNRISSAATSHRCYLAF
jgi:hypothetical protein